MTRTEKATARRLDPDRLVVSALAVADTEGLEALTIRRLAQEHDVTPMALYRHFSDKQDLLAAIGDRLLADVVLPAPSDEPWDRQLRAVLAAFVAALRPHPAAAHLTLSRFFIAEAGLNLAERILDLLVDGGFPPDYAGEVGKLSMCSLITLVTTEPGAGEAHDPTTREDSLRVKRAALGALPPRRYPRIVASADTLICPTDVERYFDLGIDLALAGIRGVLADLPTRASAG